jgi:CPA2 family monovalent cation:H+ antiporter-2
MLLGWGIGGGLLFGLALSVASTVVLLKALQDRHIIDSERGRIAVGWLIVEDLAMVLALVLIPGARDRRQRQAAGLRTAGHQRPRRDRRVRRGTFNITLGVPGIIALTVIKVAAFVGFMLIVGRRVIPMLLHYTAHTGSRELFRLAVLAIALGVAAGAAYLFGVSLALGAFFAGMILAESELSHRAAEESLPLRDAFAVLFFVAVGMLFDPVVLLADPLADAGDGADHPVRQVGFTVSASLAQIGEFSFILIGIGIA